MERRELELIVSDILLTLRHRRQWFNRLPAGSFATASVSQQSLHQSASSTLQIKRATTPRSTSRSSALLTPIILIALTAIAALLRFWHLERPPLLIDECFTFWRTCGSYSDLVETLRNDGFV